MAFYKFSVTDKGMTVILSMEMKNKRICESNLAVYNCKTF
jgi:hypothetical protein